MPVVRLPSFNDFSPKILKGDLRPCLQVVVDCGGDDKKVIAKWATMYFRGANNNRSIINLPSSLRSTGLSTGVRPIALSEVAKVILATTSAKEAARAFCAHLFREKNGNLVIEALAVLKLRGERVSKASLKSELRVLGVSKLSNATTDHTTLKNWFLFSGLISKDGAPIDAEIKSLLGVSSEEIGEFKSLTLGQQVFLNLLRKRHLTNAGPFLVKDLLGECMESQPHLFDEDHFAKKIRQPLEKGGWVKAFELATGAQGGRSGKIVGTKKLLDVPIAHVIPDFDQVVPSDLRSKLNTPLDVISQDLFGANTHKAGLALELLSLRMIIDLRLDPRSFRLRSAQTAYAEVDLIAEGSHLLFSRWTFQCKRYKPGSRAKLGLGDVAKEVGIAIFAKAHVIVMVTTTDFSQSAKNYAQEIARANHLQFVFVNGEVVREYLKSGREALWSYFQANAKTVMTAKRVQALPNIDS